LAHALQSPLAIVDLETTGGRPGSDRIIEIAVIGIDGFRQTSEWSTLVNPERAIPSPVQSLTRISDDMAASAPRFAALAGELFERLRGRDFIAHNAAFDYGFTCREFERTGLRFSAPTLCTVRLSRRLYRPHLRHDLDSLIERHGLACTARHRALDDAGALWQFLNVAQAEHGDEVLEVAARQVIRRTLLPPHLDPASIEAIPEAPGIYLFYGEAPAPLYVGKGANLRSGVLAHVSSRLGSARARALLREVRRIEWQRTAGELGASLRAERLARELAPALNRHRRFIPAAEAGEARLPAAWPHRGPIGIVEKDAGGEASEVHVVDRWRYLGSADSQAELAELLETRSDVPFNPAQYLIIARHLRRRGARIVPLGGRAAADFAA
jgi:DNA polymerase-3 subunit epsilon